MATGYTPLNNTESSQTTEPTPPSVEYMDPGNVPIIVGKRCRQFQNQSFTV
jgi:hypothetical protein